MTAEASPEPGKDMAERPVFVVGMHRSGTSAVAGALNRLGVWLGETLIEPRSGVNDGGFFENPDILALHEELLHGLGRSWRHPVPLPDGWLDDPRVAPLASRAGLLAANLARGGRWGVKDPRLCLLLPLWRRVLEARGETPAVVITVRHPAQVAASLARRDGMPEALGHFLWVLHYLQAELSSRGLARCLVRYDRLLDQPGVELDALGHWLGLDPAGAAEEGFIDARQRRHEHGELPSSTLVRRTWALLSCDDWEAVATRQRFDALRAELDAVLDDVGDVLTAQADSLARWETHFSTATAQLQSTGAALAGFDEAVERVRQRDAELIELRARLAELEAEQRSAEARASARKPGSANPRALVPAARQDHRYHGVIDLRAENNSHTRVVRYINERGSPLDGPILEVGCAGAYLGDVLRKQGYEVWGVESHPAAVVEAAERLDHVYRGTIEEFLEDPAFATRQFQFVLFGDVLEHLVDPEGVLSDVKRLLGSSGALIASVPNVAHRSVRLMLLEGRWDYDATGIMDATHLHFFTRDSLLDLFTRTGYAVQRLSAITLGTEDAGIRVNPALELMLEEHVKDAEQDVFQFVVLVTDAGDEDDARAANEVFRVRASHRILCLPPLEKSSLYSIRLSDPLKRMTELFGGEVRTRALHKVTNEDIAWADTVVFQRESNDYILSLLRRVRLLGRRVVFDIDDLLTEVPDYLSVAEHARLIRPWLESALREADAVSASTLELRNALLRYNDAIFVTPNYAYTGEAPIDHYPCEDRVRIIVASSDTVRVDFLVDSLKDICEDQELNVDLVAIGPPGTFLKQCGLPVSALPLMPHSQFKAFIATQDNTLALIPLDDNRFNRCKSPIKFFDYALAGVPCICSDVAPYRAVIEPPDNGLLCGDARGAWTRAIRELVTDPVRRADIAERARERCLKHHNLNLTAAAWEHLLRNTPEPEPLTEAELAARLRLRTRVQLVRGTVRHLLTPASYRSAWRIYRDEGLSGVREKWRTVF